MNWDRIDITIWDRLNERPASHQDFVPGEPITGRNEVNVHAFILISSDRTYHLLVSLGDETEAHLINPNAAGLQTTVLNDHIVLGMPRQDYIDIICSGRHHLESFTEIVREICQNVFDKNQNSVEAVNNVIRRWKSFWGKPPVEVMDSSKQLGLIGELIVMETLLTREIPGCVQSWTDSDNPVHDFEFQIFSLEVKTTKQNHHKHVINGLEQLEPTMERLLFLVSILAIESGEGTVTLSQMNSRISQILENLPDQYDLFHAKLSSKGYRLEHEQEYDQNRFVIREITIYGINDTFPKLDRNSLMRPLSERISDVRYTLNLEGLEYNTFDEFDFHQFYHSL